jgi:spore coat protein U-like protein
VSYQLFLDPSHTVPWGDGTAGTQEATVSGSSGTLAIYGRIPPGQRARAGEYSDAVTIVVSF